MFTGVRKEQDTVTFLAKFDGKAAKVMGLSEAMKWIYNIINFLESKIVWATDEGVDDVPDQTNHVLVQSRNAASTVIC